MVRRWIPSGRHLRNNDNTGDDDDSEFTNSMDSGMSIPSLRDSMTTRSSHNDPIKPALMNDSNKVKNLEKELTNAKIKIQVLYEYIRRIPNKDGNAPSLGNDTDFRNSIIEGLNQLYLFNFVDLKAKEVEYQDTLQFVQENLENSESIVNTINHLLSFILTHFNEQDENAHLLDKEERETLEETLELSSD